MPVTNTWSDGFEGHQVLFGVMSGVRMNGLAGEAEDEVDESEASVGQVKRHTLIFLP